ncbi:hypothetical protein [Streptomyces sp. cg35]|uniref:hypothetical protein n=1 Tax=Streptomyces sp. cg35 TaxID=3421650 RepID=UPI003D1647B9
MPTPPPEPRPTITDGQRLPYPTHDSLERAIREAAAAVAEDLPPTSYKDESATPKIGQAPPAEQPGRPPMSQKAVDDSARMLSASVLTVALGGAISGVLYVSVKADPVVVGLIAATPPAALLSLRSLTKSIKRLVPDQHHHHYEAPVTQDNRQDHSRNKAFGIVANNNPKEKP